MIALVSEEEALMLAEKKVESCIKSYSFYKPLSILSATTLSQLARQYVANNYIGVRIFIHQHFRTVRFILGKNLERATLILERREDESFCGPVPCLLR